MSDLEDEMPLAALSALKKGSPLSKRYVFHEDDERWGGWRRDQKAGTQARTHNILNLE